MTTPPTTAGARTGSGLLSTTGPVQGATDRKVESAPEVPAADDAAKLASATVPTTTATKRVIEQTEGEAPAASVKKTPTGTLIRKKPTGTLIKKTQEALRKAGDDFNKNVSNLFKPKKKESTKAKPTTQASNDGADTKGGDTKGDDK